MNWFSHDGNVVSYAYEVLAGRCLLALYAKTSKLAAKSLKLAAEEISGFVPIHMRPEGGSSKFKVGGLKLDGIHDFFQDLAWGGLADQGLSGVVRQLKMMANMRSTKMVVAEIRTAMGGDTMAW